MGAVYAVAGMLALVVWALPQRVYSLQEACSGCCKDWYGMGVVIG